MNNVPGSATGTPATAAGSAATPAQTPAAATKPVLPPARETTKVATTPKPAATTPSATRRATLRLTQVEPWSVMKTAFLLSISMGIVLIVAVGVFWGVLSSAGLWDSVNSIVQETLGDKSGAPFDIRDYVGTTRILGFTMLVAVVDVVLLTAIATLGAFLYNLAATLVGGIQVTFTEER